MLTKYPAIGYGLVALTGLILANPSLYQIGLFFAVVLLCITLIYYEWFGKPLFTLAAPWLSLWLLDHGLSLIPLYGLAVYNLFKKNRPMMSVILVYAAMGCVTFLTLAAISWSLFQFGSQSNLEKILLEKKQLSFLSPLCWHYMVAALAITIPKRIKPLLWYGLLNFLLVFTFYTLLVNALIASGIFNFRSTVFYLLGVVVVITFHLLREKLQRMEPNPQRLYILVYFLCFIFATIWFWQKTTADFLFEHQGIGLSSYRDELPAILFILFGVSLFNPYFNTKHTISWHRIAPWCGALLIAWIARTDIFGAVISLSILSWFYLQFWKLQPEQPDLRLRWIESALFCVLLLMSYVFDLEFTILVVISAMVIRTIPLACLSSYRWLIKRFSFRRGL